MKSLAMAALASCALFGFEPNGELRSYLYSLQSEAKKENPSFSGFDMKEGERIFFDEQTNNGKKISCTSCHGKDITKSGENTKTGKIIEPLSPNANPQRLGNVKDVKKWLRRNFKDVYNREGSTYEKGSVLLYIMSK